MAGLYHLKENGQPSEGSSESLHRTTQARTALATTTGRLRSTILAARITLTSSAATWASTTSISATAFVCARLSNFVESSKEHATAKTGLRPVEKSGGGLVALRRRSHYKGTEFLSIGFAGSRVKDKLIQIKSTNAREYLVLVDYFIYLYK